MTLTNMSATLVALSLALGMTACGEGKAPEFNNNNNNNNNKPAWVNKTPKLLMATPNAMAVGERLMVLGQDFIPPKRGSQVLVIKGTYYDASGTTQAVEIQNLATHVNTGKLTWTMFPNIVFDTKMGSRLGQFVGRLSVVNVGKDGTQKGSGQLPVKITVKPSIILRLARPTNSNCSSIVKRTLEKTAMAFTAQVVGLRAATKDNPLTFYWTFLAQQWKVSWSYSTFDPTALFPKKGAFVIEDRLSSGTTSTISDNASTSLLVKVGSDLLGNGKLKELQTGAVPGAGSHYTSSVSVVARDASGKQVKLSIPIDVSRMARMSYDGGARIGERFPPVQVSDCIPGHDIGRQVTYSEDTSETRSRAISFNYNANIGGNFAPIPSNPFALGINFSVGFGVDINASVSSSKSKGINISGQILPGEYGVFYRQTTKMVRKASITIRNKCGEEASAGDAYLTDWIFTPELATGPKCVPPSRLPKAEKFM